MAFPRWSTEHESFREMVRRFVLEEIRPNAERWYAEGHFPDALFERAGKLGLLGLDGGLQVECKVSKGSLKEPGPEQ